MTDGTRDDSPPAWILAGANSCAMNAYRERLHPEPDEAELAYRARLTAELERA